MNNMQDLFLGLGPIFAGTFMIVYYEKIHESVLKFFNIEDYRLKALGSRIWIVNGVALIVFALVWMID